MLSKLTYANVASTVALFLALTGGVVYAAARIGTDEIKRQAVTAEKLGPKSVKAGKLDGGSVKGGKIVDGAVTNAKIADDTIAPEKLTYPVYTAAEFGGGSAPVTSSFDPYPIDDATWTQQKGAINVAFGEATATLAYDGSGPGTCQVYLELRVDGAQVGGGQLETSSTTLEQVTQSLGAQPEIGPLADTPRTMTANVGSNGACTGASTIDSTRFEVLDFG